MKTFFKITACVLAMLFLIGVAGCAANTTDPKKIVVATVNGEPIYRSEFTVAYNKEMSDMQQNNQNFDITYPKAVKDLQDKVITALIQEKVQIQEAKKEGFNKLSQDKITETTKSVDDYLSQIKDSIKSYVTEEAKTDSAIKNVDNETQTRLDKLLKNNDTSRDVMIKNALEGVYVTSMEDAFKKKVTVADADAKKWYDTNLQTQQDAITKDPSAYDTYTSGDNISLFIPAGAVRVHQILIKLDDEKSKAAQSLYQQSGAQAALASLDSEFQKIQAKADGILAKVKAGENFDSLISQYNEDPGEKDEPVKTQGYVVVKGSTAYYSEFTDAALNLKNVGDTSNLVKTVFGYSILKNIGTVQAGAVSYDSVKDKVTAKALTEKQTTDWKAQIDKLVKAAKVEKFPQKYTDEQI